MGAVVVCFIAHVGSMIMLSTTSLLLLLIGIGEVHSLTKSNTYIAEQLQSRRATLMIRLEVEVIHISHLATLGQTRLNLTLFKSRNETTIQMKINS